MKDRKKAIEEARKKVKEAKTERDQLIIHSIKAVEEMDEVFNLFYERVENWHSLHFPELPEIVKNPETYLHIINELLTRPEMKEEKLKQHTPKAKKIEKESKKSMGAELDEKDLKQIKRLAKLAIDVKNERNEIEEYIKDVTKEVTPNLRALAGPILTARLLSLAGSLEKMAKMPASTIQVLGAEKALFAHLKKNVPPPKHGVIFNHPEVRKSSEDNRGKVSRSLANKLAIAARLDYFGDKHKGKEMKKEFQEKLKKIRG